MNQSDVTKTSTITINVGLNAEQVPVAMEWKATEHPDGPVPQVCKAMLLSLFDDTHKDTYKIDLWTQDMQVLEMDRFFYQTLRGLADTYFKATQNRELAAAMQQFVRYFGEQTEIIPK